MRKMSGLEKAMMYGLIVSVITMGVGCKTALAPPPALVQKSHNLAYVACKGGEVDIPVDAVPSILTNPDDRIVFVCKGEDVYWKTTNTNLTIKVDLKNPQLAPDLFVSSHSSVATDPNVHNQTKKETVKTPTKALVDYEYTITVDDGAGKHYSVDPHVIPM